MHRLFGKSKPKVEAPTLEDTSGGIGSRIDDIDKKIKGLDDELRKYKVQLQKASGSAAANIKKRAMDVLKRKRMYEAQRDQLGAQQFNIDQTSFAIETVKSTQTTVAAMKEASKTLKKENKKISLNEIEDMQDEMEDMLEDVGEISEILGRSYGMPDGVEEDDLDAELAYLEDEWANEEVELDAGTSIGAEAEETAAANEPYGVMPAQPTNTVFSQAEATADSAKADPAVAASTLV